MRINWEIRSLVFCLNVPPRPVSLSLAALLKEQQMGLGPVGSNPCSKEHLACQRDAVAVRPISPAKPTGQVYGKVLKTFSKFLYA